MNKTISKILIIITLIASAGMFVLARFITERNFAIVCFLALVAVAFSQKLKYGLSAILASAIITLEFLHLLPLPYNFLFSHGLSMGPAILATVIVAALYVVVVIWLVFWRFPKK